MPHALRLLSIVLWSCLLVCCSPAKEAQNKNIAQLINSRQFTFTARTALPTGGRVIQLTTPYDLRVAADSVISLLPFFGRAFQAPIGNTNPGFQFISTKFDYQKNDTKSGGWNISIMPKDVQDIRQLNLSVAGSGNASLQVISNSRQVISYNGFIEMRNK